MRVKAGHPDKNAKFSYILKQLKLCSDMWTAAILAIKTLSMVTCKQTYNHSSVCIIHILFNKDIFIHFIYYILTDHFFNEILSA